METKVVHCQKHPYEIYIGRPSVWGNPYSHKKGTLAQFKVETRKEAVAAFREYILYGEGQHLLERISELDGKILGCWCDENQSCHGKVLIEILNGRRNTGLPF